MRYIARVWGYFLLRFMPVFYLMNVPQSTLKNSFWEAEYLVPNCTPLTVVSFITRRDLTSNAISSLPDGVFKGMTNLFYLYVLAKRICPSIHPSIHPSIERFHMTSRRPYWCSKTILLEFNSFLMWTLPFVSINLHRCWSREWKRSIHTLSYQKNGINFVNFFAFSVN